LPQDEVDDRRGVVALQEVGGYIKPEILQDFNILSGGCVRYDVVIRTVNEQHRWQFAGDG
jgi:hypothetical protein